MGRARLVTGGKVLRGTFVRKDQTGGHTGVNFFTKVKQGITTGLPSVKKTKPAKDVVKGPDGKMRCPRCRKKINRKQLDAHLFAAHGLK